MSPKVSNVLPVTGIVLCVAGIVALIVADKVERRATAAEALAVRTEICANVCVERESPVAKVWEQRLGWAAAEWRCGCMDGHVQVVP